MAQEEDVGRKALETANGEREGCGALKKRGEGRVACGEVSAGRGWGKLRRRHGGGEKGRERGEKVGR